MDEIIAWFEALVSGEMTAETFAGKYITLWMELRDEYYAAEEALGLRDARVKLDMDFYSGLISEDQFEKETKQLISKMPNIRIRPDSPEAGIISHIMVEANAYEPDPLEREKYQIGESELITAVTEALEELKALRAKKL